MKDQSLFTSSQSKGISEGLQNFINAMVEEIVLEGKPFDTQKKYLKKFSENEGLNYEKLEADIVTFVEIMSNHKTAPNKLMEKFAEEKGRDCYLSDMMVEELLSSLQPTVLFGIINKGKWGLMDKNGHVVVEPQYDELVDFQEDMARVRLNNKFGFVDKRGRLVVPCIYDVAIEYRDGMAAVRSKGKWGFVDKKGNEAIPCKYDAVGEDEEWGVNGGFFEGLASVKKDGKRGYIDKDGNVAIPFEFDYAAAFSEGLAVTGKGDRLLVIDKNGKEEFELEYGAWSEGKEGYSEGLLSVAVFSDEEFMGTRWGFIDKTGEEIISCKYDYADDFHEGMASVGLNDKYGFVDKTGKEIIPCKYDYADDFSEGLACVRIDDGDNWKYGFVNKEGELVIPCKYDATSWRFKDGLAAVQLNGKWGVIDKTGTTVIPFNYDSYEEQMYNSEGKPAGTTRHLPHIINGLVKVYVEGKMTYLDITGRIVWTEQK